MSMENLILRAEREDDYRAVEELTREAFWNHYAPGCSEHYLLHVMRGDCAFIKALDMVAELDGKLCGNIVYTKSKIARDDGGDTEVLCFGPLAVHPQYQKRGIGAMLVRRTMEEAAALGYTAVLIYGDPDYYSRFGFAPAQRRQIGTADNMYADALLAAELHKGALDGCAGRFLEAPVYEISEAEAAAFDKSFPHKPLQSGLPSQEKFNKLVAARAPRP